MKQQHATHNDNEKAAAIGNRKSNISQNVSSTTANTVLSGVRALSGSPAAAAANNAASSLARGEKPIANWPFSGSVQPATNVRS